MEKFNTLVSVVDISNPTTGNVVTYKGEHDHLIETLIALAARGDYTIITDAASVILKTVSNFITYTVETVTVFTPKSTLQFTEELSAMIRDTEKKRRIA